MVFLVVYVILYEYVIIFKYIILLKHVRISKMGMRIESILWTLQKVQGGKNTLYSLTKDKNRIVYSYLKYCQKKGLLEQYEDGNRRPYRLTSEGKALLKLLGGNNDG